jgi:hypothetical protein
MIKKYLALAFFALLPLFSFAASHILRPEYSMSEVIHVKERVFIPSIVTYSFCASPRYLKEFGISEKPEDLANHRYITHSMRKPDDELVFQNKEIITLKPYIRVNDAQTMLNFALDATIPLKCS